MTHYLELKQCKLEGEHRIGVTACMYTRVFVIELLTGLLKANIKRIDALKDSIFAFFAEIVNQCTMLNLEIQTLIDSIFVLIYTCINYNTIEPIHKLLSILSSIAHLPLEIFQPLAPHIASGIAVLIAEYGPTVTVIGCWEVLVSLLVSCLQEPHAASRCYKCVVLMFSDETANSLPPSTLLLIDAILQSVYVTPELFSELMEDILILNRNCWKILIHMPQSETESSSFTESVQMIWEPLLHVVCRECNHPDKESADLALTVLWVETGGGTDE